MRDSVSRYVDYVRAHPVWSTAAALAVAVVVIPLFLLKSGNPPATHPAPATAVPSSQQPSDVVVRPAAAATLNNSDRHLVGKAKDLFAGGAKQQAPSRGAAPSAGSVPAGAATTATAGSAAAAKKTVVKKHHLAPLRRYYVVDVRFGRPGKGALQSNLPRLQPLPSPANPAAVFFGVFNGGKSAGFLVANNSLVKASSCAGHQRNCELVRLRPGRTANIALRAANGKLERWDITVTSIRRVLTRNASQAHRARTRVSRDGRCLLSTAGNAFGTYLVNPIDGSYRAADPGQGACKGLKASAARAASQFSSARTVTAG